MHRRSALVALATAMAMTSLTGCASSATTNAATTNAAPTNAPTTVEMATATIGTTMITAAAATLQASPTPAPPTGAASTGAAPTGAAPSTATAARSTVSATTSATTQEPSTTVATDATIPAGGLNAVTGTIRIGTSVQGRPITAERRGTPGGRRVLVIGVIHGDESAGLAIVDLLKTEAIPPSVDLWLVEAMNPDGIANNTRQNADQVDLNRNFPFNWGPIGAPGNSQYAGPSAGSEPETQAMVRFVSELRPDLTIWYHQDLNRISPGKGRDGAIRARYAALTGLPVLSITGGTYTGVASTWVHHVAPAGVSFIVELGPALTAKQAAIHAAAILTIATEPN